MLFVILSLVLRTTYISLYDVKRIEIRMRPIGRLNTQTVLSDTIEEWWVEEDLNLRPHAYQACALTT